MENSQSRRPRRAQIIHAAPFLKILPFWRSFLFNSFPCTIFRQSYLKKGNWKKFLSRYVQNYTGLWLVLSIFWFWPSRKFCMTDEKTTVEPRSKIFPQFSNLVVAFWKNVPVFAFATFWWFCYMSFGKSFGTIHTSTERHQSSCKILIEKETL